MADNLIEPRNALWKREEQLRRWKESETNKVSSTKKEYSNRKVRFQDGCVFLAACSSGDKDEVIRLLSRGANIDTANIDGLTALHQACIDESLDMVKFLVENGADINACDNEGWTALHATASCGYVEIARYLLSQKADVAAVNNDGELAIDIAEGDDMDELLLMDMESKEIDADAARNEEHDTMIQDATHWLETKCIDELMHPKTGATALHVAAAKGYIKVMELLLQAGADVNVKDNEHWTPLHGAAHWGQEHACKLLMQKFANADIQNLSGQTPIDVSDSSLVLFLKELKRKQLLLMKDKDEIPPRTSTQPKRRSSVTRMSMDQKKDMSIKSSKEEGINPGPVQEETIIPEDKSVPDKKPRVENKDQTNITPRNDEEPSLPSKANSNLNTENESDLKVHGNNVPADKPLEPNLSRDLNLEKALTSSNDKNSSNDVFSSTETLNNEKLLKPQFASEAEKENQVIMRKDSEDKKRSASHSSALDTVETKLINSTSRRSFEPPKRDEERETERKAKARRARETRRSTQGVTKEDLERAEQTLLTATQTNDRLSEDQSGNKENKPHFVFKHRSNLIENKEKDNLNSKTNSLVSSLNSDSFKTNYDNNNKSSNIKSSENSKSTLLDSTKPYKSQDILNHTLTGKSSADVEEDKKEDDGGDPSQKSSAIRSRRKRENRRPTGKINPEDVQSQEDSQDRKIEDTVKSSPSHQYSSRFNGSRLSRTEPSYYSLPDYSSSDLTSYTPKYSSSRYSDPVGSSVYSTPRSYSSYVPSTRSYSTSSEKDLTDYKRLYDSEKGESDRLRKEVQKLTEELFEAKSDKREKRALERKISEMEEEVKNVDVLKADNVRLKEENGALIRVISKLSK